MDIQMKRDVMAVACKMSNQEINNKINELVDIVLDTSLSEEARTEAKEISGEYVRILRRRTSNGIGNRRADHGVGCTGSCC